MTLFELQYFQELHDRKYHFDVYAKPLIGRATHLINHLVKYSSSAVARHDSYTDALACIFSLANALNINLDVELPKLIGDFNIDLCSIPHIYADGVLDDMYKKSLGKMAKLLEGHDHTESLNYRQGLTDELLQILVILIHQRDLDGYNRSGWAREYIGRLMAIKRKNIFYPHFHISDMRDQVYYSFHMYSKMQ